MTASLRFNPLRFMVAVCLTANVATYGFGQDVFGESAPQEVAADAPAAPNTKKENDLSVSEQSAVVRSLRSSQPKDPGDLARAIQLMARIQRWDQVNYWLDQVQTLGINDANAYAMVQEVGTQPFLELLLRGTEIQDTNKETLKRILDLANAKMKSPARLKSLVRELYSPNKKDRITAFLSLQSAGNRAVKALIDDVLAEPTPPNATMAEAFALMGKPAFTAWHSAMMSADSKARGRLALLAARVGEPSLALELCTVANDTRVDEDVRRELHAVASSRNKKIPEGPVTFRKSVELLNSMLKDYQRVRRNDDADAFIQWTLAKDGMSVIESPGREADLVWNRVVQLANCSVQSNLASDLDSAIAVAVLMEAFGRNDENMVGLGPVEKMLSLSIRDSYEFACLIWDASSQQDLSVAQFHAVKHLARWASHASTPGPVRERLTKAARSGYAAVRYEATTVLLGSFYSQPSQGDSKFHQESFDGRSHVEKTLDEMLQLEAQPLALVVGGSTELRTHVRELLLAFSYRSIEAPSANATMAILRDGQPVEAIFLVEKVLEMDLGQLVDRLHSIPTASTCPVAVLAASLSIGEHALLDRDPRVLLGSVPRERADFADILRRMRILSQSPKIESVQRIQWKDLSQQLARDVKNLAIKSTTKSEFAPNIQTPVGQKFLISQVLDKSLPMSKREQASQIFVQSVKQFGLLISSETADAQYDVYNTRGPTEVELRVILGRILDAIEAARGDKPWSDVAP